MYPTEVYEFTHTSKVTYIYICIQSAANCQYSYNFLNNYCTNKSIRFKANTLFMEIFEMFIGNYVFVVTI